MLLTCDCSLLTETISNISRVAAVKTTSPLMESIYMRAENGRLFICCYNMEIGMTRTIPARVEQPGAVCLPTKLTDISRKLPGSTVTISCDDKFNARVVSGASDYTLVGRNAENYPELPAVDTEHSIDLDQKLLRTVISSTSYAISSLETAPAIYRGAYFETEGDMLNVVSLDGYRLACCREPLGRTVEENYSFIVPGKTLHEIQKLLSEEAEEPAHINVAKNNILFTVNDYTVVSRLICGEYVNYRTTLACQSNYTVRVKTSDLLAGVERMAVVNSETYKSPVRCCFNKDSIRMICETPVGRAEEVVMCESDCDEFLIGFNNRYMLEAFRAVSTDEMILTLGTPVSPARVMPPEGDSFVYLLLPIRLSANQG